MVLYHWVKSNGTRVSFAFMRVSASRVTELSGSFNDCDLRSCSNVTPVANVLVCYVFVLRVQFRYNNNQLT